MSNRNGSYPLSVQPGIPNLPETPKGWKKEPLVKYLKEIKRPVQMNDNEQYQLVTVKRNRGGVKERENLLGKEIKVKSQFYVKGGDFLISKRQIVHGACGIVPDQLDGAIVSGEYAVLGTNGGIDLDYLKYLSESIHFQQTCFHSSIGVHVEKMIFKMDRWLKWDFNIPPLPEQRKISQILSTWDRAINTVENLIENNQQQRKALMQRLMTGKVRFEEFGKPANNGELPHGWQLIKLDEKCSKVGSGITPKGGSATYKKEGIPLIRSQNVLWGRLNFKDVAYIDEHQHKSMANSKVMPNDILLNITGASIGRSCVVPQSVTDANVNQHVCIIRTSGIDSDFLCQFLLSDIGQRQINILQAGGNRQGLNFQQIKSFKIPFPSMAEQKKIAKIISLAQYKILIMKKNMGSLKKEREALIQQFLTGKRRVKFDQ